MNTYKSDVRLDASGRGLLDGLPFPAGALLAVLVIDQSRDPAGRVADWRVLMRHVHDLPAAASLDAQNIADEIDAHRSG